MVERPAGIGPASRAWEARVLPLYDGRLDANDARPTPLLGELAFGVPLEHLGPLGARSGLPDSKGQIAKDRCRSGIIRYRTARV